HHAIDVALVAELRRLREQHYTECCRDYESRDQHPDGLAAEGKNSHCHELPWLKLSLPGRRLRRPKHVKSVKVYLHTRAKVRLYRIHVFLSDAKRTGGDGGRIAGEILTRRGEYLNPAIECDSGIRQVGDGALAPR